jgi:hypothetical protein
VSGPTWRFSRSWRAGVGCNSRCAITFPRFSLSLPVSRPPASQISLPLCGLGGIHEPKRRGRGVKVELRQQSHSFLLVSRRHTRNRPTPRASATCATCTGYCVNHLHSQNRINAWKRGKAVRFQDSEKSEWRAMLRRKKHQSAAYSPLYVRLA